MQDEKLKKKPEEELKKVTEDYEKIMVKWANDLVKSPPSVTIDDILEVVAKKVGVPMSGKNLPNEPEAVLYPYTPSVPLPVNLTPAELALTNSYSLPESPKVIVLT